MPLRNLFLLLRTNFNPVEIWQETLKRALRVLTFRILFYIFLKVKVKIKVTGAGFGQKQIMLLL